MEDDVDYNLVLLNVSLFSLYLEFILIFLLYFIANINWYFIANSNWYGYLVS